MERALGRHGDHGRWWNNPRMVEKLKLTDEQRKAMDAILMEHREKLIDLRANLEKAELAMEPLMRDDQPNEAKILAQIDKVAPGARRSGKGQCALPAGDSRQADAGAVEAVASRPRRQAPRVEDRAATRPGGDGRGSMRRLHLPRGPAVAGENPGAPGRGSRINSRDLNHKFQAKSKCGCSSYRWRQGAILLPPIFLW